MNIGKLIAVAAVATSAILPVRAGETLAVTLSGDNVTVTASAGALDDTSQLYLVYDSVDHGRKLSAWPAANRLQYSGATRNFW